MHSGIRMSQDIQTTLNNGEHTKIVKDFENRVRFSMLSKVSKVKGHERRHSVYDTKCYTCHIDTSIISSATHAATAIYLHISVCFYVSIIDWTYCAVHLAGSKNYPSETLKTLNLTMRPCSHDHKHILTDAAIYMCWIRRILHGWLPDNTEPGLNQTPSLNEDKWPERQPGLLIRGREIQLNATLHQIRSRSSSAGNTKLTVVFLFPLQQKYHHRSAGTDGEMKQYAKRWKGKWSRSLRRILLV